MEQGKQDLDLCFIVDCTGSMGGYINGAKKSITTILQKIAEKSSEPPRFALVSYRDHPPQDSSYVSKKFDFTTSTEKALQNVETMSASGGGDCPEALTDGVKDMLSLKWRQNATKVLEKKFFWVQQ